MKLSAKPISSPGRAEKFPPPLMRFLRSSVGSRSRGRSRSSPLFFRKKNTPIETQEPSSPKVTCMGQVRVRRSKKSGKAPAHPTRNGAPTRQRFKWIRNAFFCCHMDWKLKAKAFRPYWRKWVFSFHWCSLRKPKIKEDSSRTESNLGSKIEASVREAEEETDGDYEEESKVFASSPSSPPKNALLLTRCRSAPYRSSSLACRFWGSPLSTEESKPEPEPEPGEPRTEPENRESDNPTSERDSISRNWDQESKTDPETKQKSGSLNQFEEKIAKSANSEEAKAEQISTVRPLILTRCKSVPARTAAKPDPDLIFWKTRRMGLT